ncbi:Putative periplasmic protein [Helicobacter mustelae 12198]|uniref:Putative periplasmic protein n=2 Tax=Helicobacter mustelae TaxID=217 RepID=D3UI14_HELM1|nr:Putative periplasmic protein [Helicobacter mustelae 12198]SQH71640.1 periplasmic protein [Helicobacter mustelae]
MGNDLLKISPLLAKFAFFFLLFFGIFCVGLFAQNWKQNPLVLQNPDTFLWDKKSHPNLPFDTPLFSPPSSLWKGWRYPMDTYLQPPFSPLIPQVIPHPWFLPEMPPPKEVMLEKDYVISYQFLLKNEVPQGEKYNLSVPVSAMRGRVLDYTCEIDVNVTEDVEQPGLFSALLSYLLRQHKDDVLECLYKSGVKLREDSAGDKNAIQNKILFTLPPTWVRASLQNGYLILKIFKEKS